MYVNSNSTNFWRHAQFKERLIVAELTHSWEDHFHCGFARYLLSKLKLKKEIELLSACVAKAALHCLRSEGQCMRKR